MIKRTLYKITGLCLFALTLLSCGKNVEDGYRIEYGESSAQFTVSVIGYSTGAINDTVHYFIQAKSDFDIKSLVVSSTISGAGGSGFVIPQGNADPLIDHAYGTIQKNIKEINIYYNYIVTQDTADPVVTFKMIDQSGQKTLAQTVVTLPSLVKYYGIDLYTKSSSQTDGLSTLDSTRYRDLTNYTTITEVNKLIQRSIDIVFVVENETAWLVAPYDWRFSTGGTFIKNKTRFKLLSGIISADFEKITSASLNAIARNDSIKQLGTTSIPVNVGSIIGFFTDYNSTNSYKAGLLRVNSIHPSYCTWYTGSTYEIKMDIITQISK